MAFFDTVMGTVNAAVDSISTVAQTFVEKNRTNAKLNRLRMIMKNESELMNRAYIALGKRYYENTKNGVEMKASEEQKIFEVIETSKTKIAKARDCYRKIVDSQNDVFYGVPEANEYDSSNVVDITVACSNENEYASSPFEAADETAKPDAASTESAASKKTEQAGDALTETEPEEDTESPESELF